MLQEHLETTKIAEDTLRKSKRSRRIMEHSLDMARSTIKVWKGFQDQYQTAIRNLEKRIDYSMEVERKAEVRRLAFVAKQDRM